MRLRWEHAGSFFFSFCMDVIQILTTFHAYSTAPGLLNDKALRRAIVPHLGQMTCTICMICMICMICVIYSRFMT